MNRKIYALSALLIVCCLIGYTIATLTANYRIPSTVTVKNGVEIQVFENANESVLVTSIDWESMLPTETKEVSVWVDNTASIPLTITVLAHDLSSYATFAYRKGIEWYDYPVIRPDRMENLILSLTILEDAPETTVSFTIEIVATS